MRDDDYNNRQDAPTQTLPRDEFTVLFRDLTDNPGAVRASSRIDIADFLGRRETWTLDTFRTAVGEVSFVQRMSAAEPLRIVLPLKVMGALNRHHDALTKANRKRGARQAMATRIARGDTLGNPEALKKARAKRKGKK
jgi:hypothetical protein